MQSAAAAAQIDGYRKTLKQRSDQAAVHNTFSVLPQHAPRPQRGSVARTGGQLQALMAERRLPAPACKVRTRAMPRASNKLLGSLANDDFDWLEPALIRIERS